MENNKTNKIKTLIAKDSSDKNKNLNILILKSNNEDEIVNKCLENNFNVSLTKTYEDAIDAFLDKNKSQGKFEESNFPIVITALGINKDGSDNWQPLITAIRNLSQKVFVIVYSNTASNDPILRMTCFNEGCNMVTYCLSSLEKVLIKIKKIFISKSDKSDKSDKSECKLACPVCLESNLSEDALWVHLPLYHINYDAKLMHKIKSCPLCKKSASPNLQDHYRNLHGPAGRGEVHSEKQDAVELYAFALVVVHRKSDNKYLLVQEFANSGYWLPGGRVDPWEELQASAIRETKEEAGIDIKLTGILTVQFNHSFAFGRLRIIYYAEPIDENQQPKSIPDYESVGSSYVNYKDICKLSLRGNEPEIWIKYVEDKHTIYPLSLFTKE